MTQNLRQDIDRYKSAILQSGMAANGALCTCDLFFWFTANRSAAITSAFTDAIERRNHFVGPALVRIQMASLLTLYAAHYHERGPHEFVEEWMKGKAVSQMHDNSADGGKLMRDGYLLQRIDKELPDHVGSISELYGVASGWIHLDPKFFHSLTQTVSEDGKFQFRLFGPQFDIPVMKTKDELNWARSMLSINNLMIANLLMWASCKQEMWGGSTDEGFQTSTFKIDQLEAVAVANGLEATMLDRGNVGDVNRFLLWVNKTNPKKNLAYVAFATREQAETFAEWYFHNLSDAHSQTSIAE